MPPQFGREGVDVGVVLPAAAGAGFKRFAAGGSIGRPPRGIRHATQ